MNKLTQFQYDNCLHLLNVILPMMFEEEIKGNVNLDEIFNNGLPSCVLGYCYVDQYFRNKGKKVCNFDFFGDYILHLIFGDKELNLTTLQDLTKRQKLLGEYLNGVEII